MSAQKAAPAKIKRSGLKYWIHQRRINKNWQFYVMLLLPLAWYFIFCYMPMPGVILGFKKYKDRLNRSLDKGGKKEDNPWARVLLAALIVSLYARFLSEPVARGGIMLITMLVSAVCAFLLGLLVKKVRSLKWMTDFVMSISMIAGMVAAVLVS